MIKELLRRYKEGVHPCMLILLIRVYYDLNMDAYYDGNHIVSDEFERLTLRHIPIQNYPLNDLYTEFVDLSNDEKLLLGYYINHKLNEQLYSNK